MLIILLLFILIIFIYFHGSGKDEIYDRDYSEVNFMSFSEPCDLTLKDVTGREKYYFVLCKLMTDKYLEKTEELSDAECNFIACYMSEFLRFLSENKFIVGAPAMICGYWRYINKAPNKKNIDKLISYINFNNNEKLTRNLQNLVLYGNFDPTIVERLAGINYIQCSGPIINFDLIYNFKDFKHPGLIVNRSIESYFNEFQKRSIIFGCGHEQKKWLTGESDHKHANSYAVTGDPSLNSDIVTRLDKDSKYLQKYIGTHRFNAIIFEYFPINLIADIADFVINGGYVIGADNVDSKDGLDPPRLNVVTTIKYKLTKCELPDFLSDYSDLLDSKRVAHGVWQVEF